MPDKKLTDVTDNNVGKTNDNEIIKALEDWIKNYDGSYVNFKTLGNALDLINRLQKENEILQTNAANAFQEGLNENQKLFENTILDSFAERLKKRFAYNVVIRNTIDNVLNSMKGKNNNEPSSM